MNILTRKLSLCVSFAIAALMAAVLFTAPAAAAGGKRCGELPLSVKLSTKDPTDLLEKAQAWVYVRPNGDVRGVQVKVRRGNRVFAKGRVTGRLAGGRTTIVRLKVVRDVKRGRYRVDVKARKGGCRKARVKHRKWSFRTPSLPAQAMPFSTKIDDNVNSVRFAIRPIRRIGIGRLRATLVNANGATVGQQTIPDLGGQQMIVEIPIGGRLSPGEYKLKLYGQESSSGVWRGSTQTFRFVSGGGGAQPIPPTGEQIQKVVVDWSGGDWKGRQTGGFIAPGIGYGEIVCSPDQQWIRFYPSNGGREAAMMNWTYKNWGTFSEKSLREAKYANGTGPDFREGFNKFGPPEKYSTGEFEGIISDRGPIEGPGGTSLAPPTTLKLDWEWDFNYASSSRCHVEATFRTQTEQTDPPLARSVQIVWRREKNATPQNTTSVANFPGLGDVSAVCEAGPSGVRRLTIDNPTGAKITTREGSDDYSVTQGSGPVQAKLPNNGMLLLQLDTGQRILVSSRWKVNDPDPDRNWCVIAAQIYTP